MEKTVCKVINKTGKIKTIKYINDIPKTVNFYDNNKESKKLKNKKIKSIPSKY